MSRLRQHVALYIDLSSIVEEYQPCETLLAMVDLTVRDVITATVLSVFTMEHVKAPRLETDRRLPHERLVDLVSDHILFSKTDPKDHSSRDFNDICRVVRTVILHAYIHFIEFIDQYQLTASQCQSVQVRRWAGKMLILECDL